jgi:WD40 repeat protein
MTAAHDAFMSYSHAADARTARAFESALEKLAKPFLKLRALDVFRDETTLAAAPRLWGTIVAHLEVSKWFLLMASPEATASQWCTKEVAWWLEHRSPERILILLTGGTIAWDPDARDFDWTRTSALPDVLRNRLSEEPLYVDLRWARDIDGLSLRHARFREAAVSIAAPIRGTTREALYSEDARQFKRNRRLVRGLQLSIALVAILAVIAAVVAWRQRTDALAQRDAALRTQSLFLADLSAQRRLERDSELAVLLAREALPRLIDVPDRPYVAEAESALYAAVTAPLRTVVFRAATGRILDAVLIPGGARVLTLSNDGTLRTVEITEVNREKEAVVARGSFSAARFYRGGTRVVTVAQDDEKAFHGEIRDLAGTIERVARNVLEPDTNNPEVWEVTDDHVVLGSNSYGTLSGTEMRSIWNPATELVRRLSWTVTTPGAEREWKWVANPGGSQIAVIDGRAVALIDMTRATVDFDNLTAARPATLIGHAREVLFVQYSFDGKLLITGSTDQSARIWDAMSGTQLQALNGHSAAVLTASFSRDRRRVVTGSADSTARVWETATGSHVATLEGHRGPISTVRFTDGDRYVVTSSDAETRVWNATNQKGASGASETDRHIEIGDETVSVEVNSGTWIASLFGHDRALTSISFGPKAGLIATSSIDGTVRLWDSEHGNAVRTLRGHEGEVHTAVFDAEGTHLVTAGDTTARVWEAKTGREVAVLRHEAGEILSAQFTPDGQHVLTVSSSGTAHVWDFRASKEVSQLRGHQQLIYQALLARGGREVVTSSADGTARWWDARSGSELRRFEGHTGDVTCAALSKDETLLVTGSIDGTARIWNAVTGAQTAALGPHRAPVRRVSFGLDSNMVLTVSANSARLWDVAGGVVRHELLTESDITHAEFTPDRHRVITASADGLVRAWDAETGRLIAVVRRYPERATHAVVSPDASRIVTASEEGTAHLLRFFPTAQALIDYARVSFTRDLTEQERRRFFVPAR